MTERADAVVRRRRERFYVHTPAVGSHECSVCGATDCPLVIIPAVPSGGEYDDDVAPVCRTCVAQALAAFDDPDVGTDAYLGIPS